MKKILYITYAFGNKSPVGVGSERIVEALAQNNIEIIVITSSEYNRIIKNVRIISTSNTPRLPSRLTSFIENILGKDLYYISWEFKSYFIAKKIIENNNIDLIYTRSTPICVCPIGIKLKKNFNIPLIMHFTDPIPPPIEWMPDLQKRHRLQKLMQKYLPQANLLSWGNEYMMHYEEEILKLSLKEKSFISQDPMCSKFNFLKDITTNTDSINMVFLGNVYGNRNLECLFEAIKKLNIKYKIKLFIYGDIKCNVPSFVQIKKKTNDILAVMQNADILIDVDGDDKEPVFISSKLKDYLSVNRPILSITPKNSPSYNLLKNLKSVRVTTNNIDKIIESILELINIQEIDYDERIKLIKCQSPERIAIDIIEKIQITCQNKNSNT